MAAAPQYGTLVFVGHGAGNKSHSIDMYASDVVAGQINLDGGAGASATSPNVWIAPEDVTLVDILIHTGMTDTTMIRLISNGRPTAHTVRYAAQLDTSDARIRFNIHFKAGTQISAIQLA